jgi:hypothetical protein
LRHDLTLDPPLRKAQELLSEAYERALGTDVELSVLLLDDMMSPADAARVGRSVEGGLLLPSSKDEPRRTWFAQLGTVLVRDRGELEALLASKETALAR